MPNESIDFKNIEELKMRLEELKVYLYILKADKVVLKKDIIISKITTTLNSILALTYLSQPIQPEDLSLESIIGDKFITSLLMVLIAAGINQICNCSQALKEAKIQEKALKSESETIENILEKYLTEKEKPISKSLRSKQ